MDTQNYLRGTIEEYLRDLSERSIVPGGGSVSALAAALGAGLNLMAINYSVKPDRYGEPPEKLLKARIQQRKSLRHLSSLIDEDCRVFRELMEALSCKRDAQSEYIAAATVPMNICRECDMSMGIAVQFVEDANRNLLTDMECAARILKAAFYAARLNVKINLGRIRDRSFVEDSERELEAMRKSVDCAEKKIAMRIKDIMAAAT